MWLSSASGKPREQVLPPETVGAASPHILAVCASAPGSFIHVATLPCPGRPRFRSWVDGTMECPQKTLQASCPTRASYVHSGRFFFKHVFLEGRIPRSLETLTLGVSIFKTILKNYCFSINSYESRRKYQILVFYSGMGCREEMRTCPPVGSQCPGILLQFVSVCVELVMSPRGYLASQGGLPGGATMASPQSGLGLLRARNDSLGHCGVFGLALPLA